MINVYEFLRYQPELYKQFVCKDLLFVYYDCPQTVRSVDVFTHYNILSFVIDGQKTDKPSRKDVASTTWTLLFLPNRGLQSGVISGRRLAFHEYVHPGQLPTATYQAA